MHESTEELALPAITEAFCMLREACALPVVIHVTCLVFRRYIYIIQLDRNCLVDGLMGFFSLTY